MVVMIVTVQSVCRGARIVDYTTYKNVRTFIRARTDIRPSMTFAKNGTVPIDCYRMDIFFVKHKNMEIRLTSSFVLKSCKPVLGVQGDLLPEKLH
jgi:hypothetical protein